MLQLQAKNSPVQEEPVNSKVNSQAIDKPGSTEDWVLDSYDYVYSMPAKQVENGDKENIAFELREEAIWSAAKHLMDLGYGKLSCEYNPRTQCYDFGTRFNFMRPKE